MLGAVEEFGDEVKPLRSLLLGSLGGEERLACLEAQFCALGHPPAHAVEAESPAVNRRWQAEAPVPL